MRYLLDTHIFLQTLNNPKKLRKELIEILENPQNQIYASVVNAWEISIKNKIGKLPLKIKLIECFKKSPFDLLDISLDHILQLDKLPLDYKDPFDRILVAQAQFEKLTLITSDPKIWKYKVKLLKS